MIYNTIKSNAYFDSVTLMLFSSHLNAIEGVEEAAVMMGTDHNKELMLASGLLTEDQLPKITGNDLVIGIKAATQAAVDEALKVLTEQFENKTKSSGSSEVVVRSVEAAVKHDPNLNFAVVSIPGRFAKPEAMKCLKNNMHVLLFSDNVSLEDENELKDYAVEHGLLMMGPDCGTAIVNGVALGFANVVKRGSIGIVAASGTGAQEVSVLIDKLGGGISQLLGTGGRDVKESVGGKMMLLALEALAADSQTKVIGIVSKPPYKSVMKKILAKLETIDKPVVACFLGGDNSLFEETNIIACETLEATATQLVKHEKGSETRFADLPEVPSVQLDGKYIRGLYTGGTLAYESMLLLQKEVGDVYANIAIDPKFALPDVEVSQYHAIVDMGEDYFTDGMPHPMIDPRLRSERIKKEVADPETAVLLLDCVLGYGSHPDPAGALVSAIESAKKAYPNRKVHYVASVCGTDSDPQNGVAQREKLVAAGVTVLPTNAQAAAYAAALLKKGV